MEQKKTNIEYVKRLIAEVFRFLEQKYLLSPTFKQGDSKLFVESFAVEYTNEITRRNVRISYSKGDTSNIMRHTFSASIIRLPYSSWEDYLSLSDYLKSKGKDFNTNIDLEFNHIEAKEILEKIGLALKEYCDEILNGNLWYEKFYPKKD